MSDLERIIRAGGSAKLSMPKSANDDLPVSNPFIKKFTKSLEAPWRGFKSCVGKSRSDVGDKDTKKESIKRKGGGQTIGLSSSNHL